MESTTTTANNTWAENKAQVQELEALTVQKGVRILDYLRSIGIKFSIRVGPKEIASNFTNLPVTREDTKCLADYYESINVTKHNSGEFPCPENLAQYEHCKFFNFNENNTAFIVQDWRESFFSNKREYGMYQKAYSEYMENHYPGSLEEQMDQRKETDDEMKYLRNNIHLPKGCYFKESGSRNHISLVIDTFKNYVYLRDAEGYDQWDNTKWGQFKFNINKHFSYSLGSGDLEQEKEHLENNFFSVMDNIDGYDALYYFQKEVFLYVLDPDLKEYVESSIEVMKEKINLHIAERDLLLDAELAKLNAYPNLPDDCAFKKDYHDLSKVMSIVLHIGSYRSHVYLFLSGTYDDLFNISEEESSIFPHSSQMDFKYEHKSDNIEENRDHLRNNFFNVLDEVQEPAIFDYFKTDIINNLWLYGDLGEKLFLEYFKEREQRLSA